MEHNNDVALAGSWSDGSGTLFIDNADDSLTGWASFDADACTGGDVYMPITYLIALFASGVDASGVCHAQWKRDERSNFSVSAALDGGMYETIQLPQVYAQAHQSHSAWDGSLLIGVGDETYVSGSGTYHTDGQVDGQDISGSLFTTRPITVGGVTLSSGRIYGSGSITDGDASAHMLGAIMRPDDADHVEEPVQADISLANHAVHCTGAYDQYTCSTTIADECGTYYMRDFELQDGAAMLAAITGTLSDTYDIRLNMALLQRIFEYTTGFSMRGDGDVCISVHRDGHCFAGDISTQHLRIHLPMTYQLIQSMSGSFLIDPTEKHVVLSDVCCDLYKGLLVSSRIACGYDAHGMHALHMPVQIHDVFLHWKRDVFMQTSGALVIGYDRSELIDLSGFIQVDQSYARGNPFSSEVQRLFLTSSMPSADMGLPDVSLRLHAMTGMPLEVDTPFLQASAHIDGSVTGSLSAPEIEGSVNFLHGSLLFPYQPLYITKGSLAVVPHQPNDMFVELVARNTIKQYDISLYVDGTLSDPHISLESIPTLDKEQIVTLLMGGSEDGSLYVMMPKLVADSVEDLMFGSADSAQGVKNYIQRIFRPFRHIRFIPGFSDQSARGGLRGSLSIEVNERLRALIQKNFSLSEDAAFEVSYLMSDDTIIRLLKDERGDLGGELETRWRF
jgi:hypothetical protein